MTNKPGTEILKNRMVGRQKRDGNHSSPQKN
jgi:hypothetical protein